MSLKKLLPVFYNSLVESYSYKILAGSVVFAAFILSTILVINLTFQVASGCVKSCSKTTERGLKLLIWKYNLQVEDSQGNSFVVGGQKPC